MEHNPAKFSYGNHIEKPANVGEPLVPYISNNIDEKNAGFVPLKSINVDIEINGNTCQSVHKLIFKNEFDSPISISHLLPVSIRSAVFGLEAKLISGTDDSTDARNSESVSDNQSTISLEASLKMMRPNIIRLEIPYLAPGDSAEICFKTAELLTQRKETVEFALPTVVAPRFSLKSKETTSDGDMWVEQPFTDPNSKIYNYDFTIKIDNSVNIAAITCPSHKLMSDWLPDGSLILKPSVNEHFSGNRDLIIEIQYNTFPATGLEHFDCGSERFFFLKYLPEKLLPQKDFELDEYLIVIDTSSSMAGEQFNLSKEYALNFLNMLKTIDKFNIITFSAETHVFSDYFMFASRENLDRAYDFLNVIDCEGTTNLKSAIDKIFQIRGTLGFKRKILIISDGWIDFESEIMNLIKELRNGESVYAIGTGAAPNRYLIEGMGRAGAGAGFILPRRLGGAESLKNMFAAGALHGAPEINISSDVLEVCDCRVLKQPAFESGRPYTLVGKLNLNCEADIISLKGSLNNAPLIHNFALKKNKPSEKCILADKIWAALSVLELNFNPTENSASELIELGRKYEILTNYYPLVSHGNSEYAALHETIEIKQLLPIPLDYSDSSSSRGFIQHKTAFFEKIETLSVPFTKSASVLKQNRIEISDDLPDYSGVEGGAPRYSMKLACELFIADKNNYHQMKKVIEPKLSELHTAVARINGVLPGAGAVVAMKFRINSDGKTGIIESILNTSGSTELVNEIKQFLQNLNFNEIDCIFIGQVICVFDFYIIKKKS